MTAFVTTHPSGTHPRRTPHAVVGVLRTLRAAWQRRRRRQAVQALLRRALDYAATQPEFAAELAAAAGFELEVLDRRGEARD